MEHLEIDGRHAGGQVLRSALALSLCTGIGFTMTNIRGARPRPGLMRQHLAAVRAALQISDSRAEGDALGSTTLRFVPGAVRGGEHSIAIGSAGSTTLVVQTVLPALWAAGASARLVLEGGTHNPMAPSANFLIDSFLPPLRRMGLDAALMLERHGFFPAGGGRLVLDVSAGEKPRAMVWDERTASPTLSARVLVSGLSPDIGLRELAVLRERLGIDEGDARLHEVKPAIGPGNVAMVAVDIDGHRQWWDSHGERGLSAEAVALRLAERVQRFVDSGAVIGEHLADQLLLPMALAGGGAFLTETPCEHLRSNAALIEKFLPLEFLVDREDDDAWWVKVVA